MGQYRTLEPVTYVTDGAIKSAKVGRVLELTTKEAETLAGKVVEIVAPTGSMFPTGAPVLNPAITRDVPASGSEPVEAPAKPAKAEPVKSPELPFGKVKPGKESASK